MKASSMLNMVRRFKRRVYAIGIYGGDSPVSLGPISGVQNPVLTHESVTDAHAFFVADPFMIEAEGAWHMFFEALIWKNGGRFGVICHADSRDGLSWTYRGIVLGEKFHLSYPYVFSWGSDFYMIPETTEAGGVRLYRADPFPSRWTYVKDLVTGPVLVDNSIFHRDGSWWMFADTSPGDRHDTLSLFHARDLLGPWTPHPKNPLVQGNNRTARCCGRVVCTPERMVRFAQDCSPDYGMRVRAFEIRTLTEQDYAEREIFGSPILRAGSERWNRGGMHHVDAHLRGDGSWLAAVDGWHMTVVKPREVMKVLSGRWSPRTDQG